MVARASSSLALCTLLAAGALAVPAAPAAQAAELEGEEAPVADAVGFVVVRENGSGSAAQAQSYLDTLFAGIAKRNGWPGAEGKYFTSRSKAVKYIEETKPSFGFFSYGAFLGLRTAHGLSPVAVADASASGGSKYFVIGKKVLSVDECKGKSLATNHGGDPRFIDNVVSGDAFDLSDFTIVETRRPVQTIKAVIEGEAECALVDDAQISAMSKVEGGALLRVVWQSRDLPAVIIASFGSASKEHAESFANTIEAMCDDEGREACDAAGLEKPVKVEPKAFAEDQAAYDG